VKQEIIQASSTIDSPNNLYWLGASCPADHPYVLGGSSYILSGTATFIASAMGPSIGEYQAEYEYNFVSPLPVANLTLTCAK
jgi:hypothetical protein